ncbi:MAG: DUF397 domain-containing protein [Mycobacterium sp.]|nr:DUF397 domain-containing protein [Mycobacterium sp.]
MEGTDRAVTAWRKSSYSGASGNNCVEVAASATTILIRDTKNPTGTVLTFAPATWHRFAASVKR